MKSYKIIEIQNHNNDHIHVIGRRGRNFINQSMPAFYEKYARVGAKFTEYADRFEMPIAYGLSGKIYIISMYDGVRAARSFLDGMKGINEYSLDKLWFNLAVARALWKNKITPTISSVANLVMLRNR